MAIGSPKQGRERKSRWCRCGAAPSRTQIWRRRSNAFATRRSKARRSFVCRSCFARNIFASRKTTRTSRWPKKFPGRSTDALGDLAQETGVGHRRFAFRKASAGVYHNTAAIIDADGKLLGKYRKMHIPDDPLVSTKNFTSRRAIWVSKRGRRSTGKSASVFAGTNGIRKRRG